jgi:TolA-binding protein
MMRRAILAFFFILFFTATAVPRWDAKDRQYLEGEFRALREQIQATKSQMDSLNAQLTELRQAQIQVQAVLIRQQRTLQDMDQMVSSLRLSHEENLANLKTTIAQLRTDQEAAFAELTGRVTETGGGGAEVGAVSPTPGIRTSGPPAAQGYVTIVEGDNVTVDLGTAQGVQQGTRLAVYKAADPGTRVGVLEVIQVMDAGNSRARILTMNTGIRPEFSDIVRLE